MCTVAWGGQRETKPATGAARQNHQKPFGAQPSIFASISIEVSPGVGPKAVFGNTQGQKRRLAWEWGVWGTPPREGDQPLSQYQTWSVLQASVEFQGGVHSPVREKDSCRNPLRDSTANYIQYLVKNYNGKESGKTRNIDIYIYMYNRIILMYTWN